MVVTRGARVVRTTAGGGVVKAAGVGAVVVVVVVVVVVAAVGCGCVPPWRLAQCVLPGQSQCLLTGL